MAKVLVTGGTGYLGRHVVTRLIEKGFPVRIMSRKPQSTALHPGSEWIQANLETGQGISQAVQECDAIVHVATNLQHTQQSDVEGTRRLLTAAHDVGVGHIIYISIVGIDHIPFAYYRYKLATEEVVKESSIPWSILRATQFHELADAVLQAVTKLPFAAFVPTDFKAQTVDSREVAFHLCELVESGPSGRVPDFGGPEVLTFGEMAQTWLNVRSIRRMIIPLWLPGGFAHGFRHGENTSPNTPFHGNTTWSQWVQERYSPL